MRTATAAVIAGLLAIVLGVAPASGEGPARPRPLRFAGVEGLPADSLLQSEFLSGFDATFDAATFPLEHATGAAATQENRFGRGAGPGDEDAWELALVVRVPPPYSVVRSGRKSRSTVRVDPRLRASRGMTVAVTVTSPEDARQHRAPEPLLLAFAFPQSVAPAQVLSNVPQGFRIPWSEAGRATARLALEALHHRSGDLAPGSHADLSPAIRTEPGR